MRSIPVFVKHLSFILSFKASYLESSGQLFGSRSLGHENYIWGVFPQGQQGEALVQLGTKDARQSGNRAWQILCKSLPGSTGFEGVVRLWRAANA